MAAKVMVKADVIPVCDACGGESDTWVRDVPLPMYQAYRGWDAHTLNPDVRAAVSERLDKLGNGNAAEASLQRCRLDEGCRWICQACRAT